MQLSATTNFNFKSRDILKSWLIMILAFAKPNKQMLLEKKRSFSSLDYTQLSANVNFNQNVENVWLPRNRLLFPRNKYMQLVPLILWPKPRIVPKN